MLDYSSNSLTGPIPSNVSGLRNLQSLYLSSNYLNGTIPSWIFSLPSLRVLDLSNNTFSGKIQEFKSKTLSTVTLKQNKLEGPIPKVPQAITPSELDQEEEEDSPMISWQAVLMGYGCGLVIGMSVGCAIGTHNYYENEKAQEKILVSSYLQAVFMGCGCGLAIGQSVIYIMLSTQYPTWFSRMVVKLEQRIVTRMTRHKKRYWCVATSTYST
ncbi:hypothetical protein H5410_000178 [Solanum commersonii]|uniref:Uncharacterized protein n=1 Tax=Solanum commersonii TaxID=4109 RepID=A0A9J6AV59_SOLCO|nr:hypothetical protein H5410_000178 [Solanum commersonii]